MRGAGQWIPSKHAMPYHAVGVPMMLPDWRTLILQPGVLAEPMPGRDRLVLWMRGPCADGWQEWQRISTTNPATVTVEHGVSVTVAKLIRTRHRRRGFVARLVQRF